MEQNMQVKIKHMKRCSTSWEGQQKQGLPTYSKKELGKIFLSPSSLSVSSLVIREMKI